MNYRYPISAVVCIELGAAIGGLQAYTILYEFGVVPIRLPLVLAVIAGILLSLRGRGVVELVALFVGTLVVAMVASAAFQSMPVFVLEGMSLLEQNFVLMNALNKSLYFTFLSAVFVAAGVVVAAIVVDGLSVGDELTSADPVAAVLVAGTLLLVVGVGAGATVGTNYASALDQRDVDATVEGVLVTDETVEVTLSLENRLAGSMRIDSILLAFVTETTRATVPAYPPRSIPAGSGERIVVITTCRTLTETENFTRSDEVTVGGYVSVRAFNGYTSQIPIADHATDQPC